MVKLGPASAMTLPASTSSAVGLVSAVVFELMPSLTSAPTVTEAVLVVLQLPALPLHCAFAWVAPMAVASTIAARIERVAFIFGVAPKRNLMVPNTIDVTGNRSFQRRLCIALVRRDQTPSVTRFSERNPLTLRVSVCLIFRPIVVGFRASIYPIA